MWSHILRGMFDETRQDAQAQYHMSNLPGGFIQWSRYMCLDSSSDDKYPCAALFCVYISVCTVMSEVGNNSELP